MPKSKILIWVIATIALGALSTGVWKYILEPRLFWAYSKPDLKIAKVIKKPILTPPKSDFKSATVIKKRIWTPFKKVQANSIPPLDTIRAIKLHFNLECDDTTIPLMIRTAAGANGNLASTVAGSSGVINQLITEKQTFYFSVSHPSIKARIKVLGYIKNPKTK